MKLTNRKILEQTFDRRKVLKLGLVSFAGLALTACKPMNLQSSNDVVSLNPTPACSDSDSHKATISQTAGPFYTPDTPLRTSLVETGMAGTALVVVGKVLDTDCQPIANALLDFWQADDSGEYDNVGFKLRGHQFSDDSGNFRLETILPGLYPGRTRHIHVRAQRANGRILTTQLYFPDESKNNQRDGIFDQQLLMEVVDTDAGQEARFNFVLS